MNDREWVLFPGCSIDGAGKEYGLSTLAVMEALGCPVRVLEDWNCCGATAARSEAPQLAVRLSGRNLALAARQGCDVLVNCAACYNNLSYSRHYLTEHPDAWPEPSEPGRAPQDAGVHHLLEVLTAEPMLHRLRQRVVRPLTSLRLACYYGCLLVRPGGYVNLDDPENPTRMDEVVRACGAETVDWSHKTDCCGGSFALTRRETAVDLIARIFESALQRGVDGLVTACPLCQMNLDSWQRSVGKAMGRKVSLPVYYFTELMAFAMGLDGVRGWLKSHMTRPKELIDQCK